MPAQGLDAKVAHLVFLEPFTRLLGAFTIQGALGTGPGLFLPGAAVLFLVAQGAMDDDQGRAGQFTQAVQPARPLAQGGEGGALGDQAVKVQIGADLDGRRCHHIEGGALAPGARHHPVQILRQQGLPVRQADPTGQEDRLGPLAQGREDLTRRAHGVGHDPDDLRPVPAQAAGLLNQGLSQIVIRRDVANRQRLGAGQPGREDRMRPVLGGETVGILAFPGGRHDQDPEGQREGRAAPVPHLGQGAQQGLRDVDLVQNPQGIIAQQAGVDRGDLGGYAVTAEQQTAAGLVHGTGDNGRAQGVDPGIVDGDATPHGDHGRGRVGKGGQTLGVQGGRVHDEPAIHYIDQPPGDGEPGSHRPEPDGNDRRLPHPGGCREGGRPVARREALGQRRLPREGIPPAMTLLIPV